ncbi:hypothetical protein SUGI_0412850 [Cryptomeria japonica]|nr:hypothetical protein SUGI_0412850 [Cryptomeria japonica]
MILDLWRTGYGCAIGANGTTGRISILWNKFHFTEFMTHSSDNILTIQFKDLRENNDLTLTNIHGPNSEMNIIMCWNELRSFREVAPEGNWIVAGDFNATLSPSEKFGGDNSTKLFHLATKMRRQHSKIVKITLPNGYDVEDIEVIKKEGVNFFSNLLGDNQDVNVQAQEDLLNFILNLFNEDDNQMLMDTFSMEDIRAATFSLGAEKAPRPNGGLDWLFKKKNGTLSVTMCGLLLRTIEGKRQSLGRGTPLIWL